MPMDTNFLIVSMLASSIEICKRSHWLPNCFLRRSRVVPAVWKMKG